MTFIAKLNRIAVCAAIAWVTAGTGSPSSADEGWATVHTAKTANNTGGERTKVRQAAHQTVSRASEERASVRKTSFRVASPKNCDCGRCGTQPKRHPVGKTPIAKEGCCTLYGVFDGVAGGIEHVLGLEPPAKKLARCGCNDGGCKSGSCPTSLHQLPAARPLAAPKRLPSHSSTNYPLPPSLPLKIERVPDYPQNLPLTHPIEDLEPRSVPRLPAPVVPDELADPFEDDQAWLPGRNASIKRSAYYE